MTNRTYSNCKLLITNNRYEYNDMYAKLDLFYLRNRISEAEYNELVDMLVAPEPETPVEPVPEEPVTPPEEPTTTE